MIRARREDSFEFPVIDRWIQRVAAGTLVALALSLIGLGIAFYAPTKGITAGGLTASPALSKEGLTNRQ